MGVGGGELGRGVLGSRPRSSPPREGGAPPPGLAVTGALGLSPGSPYRGLGALLQAAASPTGLRSAAPLGWAERPTSGELSAA